MKDIYGRFEVRRRDVPDETLYDPTMNAYLSTGLHASAASDTFPAGATLAADIETPGLDRQFQINCLTFAWHRPDGSVQSILLDPSRDLGHAAHARYLFDRAGKIVFHNAPFDTPALVLTGLLERGGVRKVTDTMVLARMAWPDPWVRINHKPVRMPMKLEGLAVQHLGFNDYSGGLELAFKAAGYKNKELGYANMDINSPTYRRGAMADTVVTLLLEPICRAAAITRTVDHPFSDFGATTTAAAADILATQELVHRVMLWRTARGINVDRDYMTEYQESVDGERSAYERVLAEHGLEGGKGKESAIVQYIHDIGELPAGWPRTEKTNKLSATKELLDAFDHPLAKAQRGLAATDQILGYLAKVDHQSRVTGRCHPQIGTLGASQTGRMSASSPPLQQFSGPARGILVDDGRGLTSMDWSQIEPVTMSLMAHDAEFLQPFLEGADLYEPIMRAAGIERKVAKVALLQTMYGSGDKNLAQKIGHTVESAAQIKRQMFSAMRGCEKFMAKTEAIAEQYGCIVTVGGRILPVDPDGTYKAVNYICVSPDTPILTADLRHVSADTVSVGDQLVGFDEHRSAPNGKGTGKRFYRVATVEDVRTFRRPGVRIMAGDRVTTCSAEHLWLVRCPDENVRMQWVRADELRPGYHQLASLGVWETDNSREAGYLAGLYDGEGHLGRRQLVFSQKPGSVLDTFTSTMDKLGLTYSVSPRTPGSTSPTDNVRIHGLARTMMTVGRLRPQRFIDRATEIFDGAEMHTSRQLEALHTVQTVTPIGDIDVVSIQTSTRTMVANGYLSHNCQGSAYDVLAWTICEADKAGVSDDIVIAMHDELVTETPAAEVVQEIMGTLPPFLERWAGRNVPLRTDRADMGRHWQSV